MCYSECVICYSEYNNKMTLLSFFILWEYRISLNCFPKSQNSYTDSGYTTQGITLETITSFALSFESEIQIMQPVYEIQIMLPVYEI